MKLRPILALLVVLFAGAVALSGAARAIGDREPAARGVGCGADPAPSGGDGYQKGTKKADVINGGPGYGRLDGFAGPDCIDGGAGLDVIFGGKDKDRLTGGPGLDFIYGGAEADRLIATDGEVDFIYGGNSNDRIEADATDWCYGQLGDDEIVSGCHGRVVN